MQKENAPKTGHITEDQGPSLGGEILLLEPKPKPFNNALWFGSRFHPSHSGLEPENDSP